MLPTTEQLRHQDCAQDAPARYSLLGNGTIFEPAHRRGWFYLSTAFDDFSRYIVAWKLCTTMSAADVSATLKLALQAAGLDQIGADRRPRLLSDNGPSYVANDLADWLEEQGMRHTRGRPYHPITQGKIERWHLSLESRILLKNYYLPGTPSEPLPTSSTTTITDDITRAWTTSLPLTSTSDAPLESWNADET